jgi:large subunit ribosomal protein L25
MKTIQLAGNIRSEFGKSKIKNYRKQDLVPASLYSKEQTVQFTVTQKDTVQLIYTPETFLVDLKIGSDNHKAILTKAQFHPVFEYLLHLEFLKVREDVPVQVSLPVRLTGTAEGALAGGKLVQKARKLTVRGLYKDLPDFLDIDVTNLKLGRSLKVGDLRFEKFMVAMPKDLPLATVEITRALRQEAARGGR